MREPLFVSEKAARIYRSTFRLYLRGGYCYTPDGREFWLLFGEQPPRT